MKTRDRIKATAVALFNEKGATNVSTVQISEVLGISPGKSLLLLHQQRAYYPLHLGRRHGPQKRWYLQ
jgi:hypothetical protein